MLCPTFFTSQRAIPHQPLPQLFGDFDSESPLVVLATMEETLCAHCHQRPVSGAGICCFHFGCQKRRKLARLGRVVREKLSHPCQSMNFVTASKGSLGHSPGQGQQSGLEGMCLHVGNEFPNLALAEVEESTSCGSSLRSALDREVSSDEDLDDATVVEQASSGDEVASVDSSLESVASAAQGSSGDEVASVDSSAQSVASWLTSTSEEATILHCCFNCHRVPYFMHPDSQNRVFHFSLFLLTKHYTL